MISFHSMHGKYTEHCKRPILFVVFMVRWHIGVFEKSIQNNNSADGTISRQPR